MSAIIRKTFLVLFLLAAVAAVTKADLFGDLLGFDLVGALTESNTEEKKAGQRDDEEGASTCDCKGHGCNCCIDFNLTSIVDLGGPGCVNMKYLSQDEGVSLNVSYGNSLLHSQTVKQNDKKGSCMDLLSKFAQICAKFTYLKKTDDGLEGCLDFQPHVLGEVTTKYHIGCFKMNSDGMVQDTKLEEEKNETEEPEEEGESTSIIESAGQIFSSFLQLSPGKKTENIEQTTEGSEVTNEAESTDDNEEGSDADDEDSSTSLLESAGDSISFFTDLIGLSSPKKKKKTTTEAPKEDEEATDEVTTESAEDESRKFHNVKSSFGRYSANNLF